MKKQMTQIGIGIAALSALAVEGKNFNRDELNAMLDRLAASPEPKVRRGPQATCYSVAVPQPERFEYVCKNCGMHTVYPRNNRRMANTLSRYRDDAASLRALGLDIALDESVLCQKCNPFTQECWINAKYISETGELLGDNVNIRSAPRSDSQVRRTISRYELLDYELLNRMSIFKNPSDDVESANARLRRLPARPGDPVDWVRIDPIICGIDRIEKLAWVINGKRTIVDRYDARILRAFLTGEKTWRGDWGDQHTLKESLPRLQQLLGTATVK